MNTQRKSFHQVIFDGWIQLIRSRDVIIRDFYDTLAKSKGIALDRTLNALQARDHILDRQNNFVTPTDVELDTLESKVILASRLCGAWIVLWTSILPLVAAGFFAVYHLLSIPKQNVDSILFICIITVSIFYVMAFLGLLIQALFVRPVVAFLNWLLGLPEIGI